MCFAPQRRALFQHRNFQKWSENGVFCTCWLGNVLRATTACTFSTSEPPKVVRTPSVFMCFWHFDFEMCFAPQRRALFRHLNFQKSSDTEVFCTFWLGNVLRATTACTFSTSQLPKVVPQRRALFRHRNFQKCSDHGVLCTFSLRNVLRTTTACHFSSLIWPAGSAPAALASYFSTLRSPKSLEKHSVSRLSYLFAHLHLLSSDSFSSDLLSSNLSLLSASALLCFSSVHIVGSLTSKLPSGIHTLYI